MPTPLCGGEGKNVLQPAELCMLNDKVMIEATVNISTGAGATSVWQ